MVKVKICGFTRPEDVKLACKLGANMVGVIMVQKSPRNVSVDRAKKMLAAAEKGVETVAVIMPQSTADIERISEELQPDYLQLHLKFPASDLREVKKSSDARMIVVVSIPQMVENSQKIVDLAKEADKVADLILLDTKGLHGGGTGLTHDWNLSREIRAAVKKPVLLAGGLNPSNVRQAIRVVRPYGVDVATGVESSLGVKSHALMQEFMTAVKEASHG